MTEEEIHEIGCICHSYDGRGRSVCGLGCPMHPADGECPDCKKTKTHGGVRCFPCDAKWAEANKPKSCKAMSEAYSYMIKVFHALERWERIEDRNPELSLEEVRATINDIRSIWKDKIIPWHIAEDGYHNWHDPE